MQKSRRRSVLHTLDYVTQQHHSQCLSIRSTACLFIILHDQVFTKFTPTYQANRRKQKEDRKIFLSFKFTELLRTMFDVVISHGNEG